MLQEITRRKPETKRNESREADAARCNKKPAPAPKVLIPSTINHAEILRLCDGDQRLYEKTLVILGVITQKYVNGKWSRRSDEFLRLRSKDLRKLVGNEFGAVIELLVHADVLEVDTFYVVGVMSRSYRLCRKHRNAECVPYEIEDGRLAARLKRSREQRGHKSDRALQNLRDIQSRVEIDAPAAYALIEATYQSDLTKHAESLIGKKIAHLEEELAKFQERLEAYQDDPSPDSQHLAGELEAAIHFHEERIGELQAEHEQAFEAITLRRNHHISQVLAIETKQFTMSRCAFGRVHGNISNLWSPLMDLLHEGNDPFDLYIDRENSQLFEMAAWLHHLANDNIDEEELNKTAMDWVWCATKGEHRLILEAAPSESAHSPSSLYESYRQQLTTVIDIARQNQHEIAEFLAKTQEGQWYEWFCTQAEAAGDITFTRANLLADRRALKGQIFGVIYGTIKAEADPVTEAWQKAAPAVFQIVKTLKLNHHAALPKNMQMRESEVFVDKIALSLTEQGIHVLLRHDGIAAHKRDLLKIIEAINAAHAYVPGLQINGQHATEEAIRSMSEEIDESVRPEPPSSRGFIPFASDAYGELSQKEQRPLPYFLASKPYNVSPYEHRRDKHATPVFAGNDAELCREGVRATIWSRLGLHWSGSNAYDWTNTRKSACQSCLFSLARPPP